MHLRFAAKSFHIGGELTLIAADRPAQGVVIGKNGSETKGQYGGMPKTIGNHTCMIDGRFLF
jgi:hypothetical protein